MFIQDVKQISPTEKFYFDNNENKLIRSPSEIMDSIMGKNITIQTVPKITIQTNADKGASQISRYKTTPFSRNL